MGRHMTICLLVNFGRVLANSAPIRISASVVVGC